jgi:hypothetical protein
MLLKDARLTSWADIFVYGSKNERPVKARSFIIFLKIIQGVKQPMDLQKVRCPVSL